MELKELIAFKEDKKEARKFASANRKAILSQKKMGIKHGGGLILPANATQTQKAKMQEDSSLVLDVVGNSCGFMDSHLDVSLKGSFTRTVNGGAKNARFLEDHKQLVCGIIGTNKGVRVEEVSIRQLGYDKDGSTECFIMTVEPKEKYSKSTYYKYQDGEIKEHSIGLMYDKITLAVNDPYDKEGYEDWQKYIGQVINREVAEDYGFFFAVIEQKVLEMSAVVFGSNEYTPILGAAKNFIPIVEPKQNNEKSKDFFNYLSALK